MKKAAMLTLFPLSMGLTLNPMEDEILREGAERLVNGGLTDKEVEEGYFMDPVLGKCNIRKAMSERAEAIRREYEAFDIMHRNDGTLVKSKLRL